MKARTVEKIAEHMTGSDFPLLGFVLGAANTWDRGPCRVILRGREGVSVLAFADTDRRFLSPLSRHTRRAGHSPFIPRS